MSYETPEGEEIKFWDAKEGPSLKNTVIAFDTETYGKGDLSKGHPQLSLCSVSDGETHFLVHPTDLAAFLSAYSSWHIVTHNGSFDYWVVKCYLDSMGLDSHSRSWEQLVEEGRFHDTMLLDKLTRLARGDCEFSTKRHADDPIRKEKRRLFYKGNLGEIAKAYGCPFAKDSNDPYRLRYGELVGLSKQEILKHPEAKGFLSYALGDAIATKWVWDKLSAEAEQIALHYSKNPHIYSRSLGSYGILTEAIQVKGAIALRQVEVNGLGVDLGKVAVLEYDYRDAYDEYIKYLDKNHYDILQRYKKKIAYKLTKKSQTPKFSQKELHKILLSVSLELKVERPVSKGKEKRMSLSVKEWMKWKDKHPFLKVWCEEELMKKMLGFFKIFNGLEEKPPKIHPRYNFIMKTGRVSCNSPNVTQFPRKKEFRALFIPSPGHSLFTVDYSFAELRTLASICVHRFGYSKLADVIKAGLDPHCHTASIITGIPYNEILLYTTCDGESVLRQSKKFKEYKHHRQAAKAINFGVPGGLGILKLVDYAKAQYGVTLTEEEAKTLKDKLIYEVYPELNPVTGYLASTTIEAMAEGLGLDRNLVWKTCEKHKLSSQACMFCIEKVLEGKAVKANGVPYEPRFVNQLWNLAESLSSQSALLSPKYKEAIKNKEGSTDLHDNFFVNVALTSTGRCRRNVDYTEGKNSPFQGLAADGGKIAAWEMIKRGIKVCAFVHDEFIIDVPNDKIEEQTKLATDIMNSSLEGVMDNLVPSKVEGRVGDCWLK